MNKILLLLCFWASTARAQSFENIVFEGAGIRGIAYGGALKALEEAQQIQYIKRVGGTSAGAITAALLAVGYSGTEIAQIIATTNFAKFNDGGMPLLGGIRRLSKNYGWYKGKKFEQWLGKLIAAKMGDANIDFATLLTRTGKELHVTGTCLDLQQVFVFNHISFPKMPIKTAVRVSMSVPMYYAAVLMDDEGRVYKRMPKQKPVHVLVDGGFFMNFPVQLFDSSRFIGNMASTNAYEFNAKTIGCRIDRAAQIAVDYSAERGKLAPVSIRKLPDYLSAFVILITERLGRPQLVPNDWQRTVSISDGGIGPKVRGMQQKELDLLLQNGYQAMQTFLANRK